MKTNDKTAMGSGGGFKGGPTTDRTTATFNKGALASAASGEFKGGPSKATPGDGGKPDATMASRSETHEFRGGQAPTVGHSRGDHKQAMRGENPIVGKQNGTSQGDPMPRAKAQTEPRGPKAPAPKPKKHQPMRQLVQGSRRSAPAPVDPDESQEDPTEEASESPSMESSEDAQEPDEGGDAAAPPGPGAMPQDATQGGAGSPDDPKAKELFDLAVARALDVLSKQGDALDAALRADPVKATVGFGTAAVHTISMAADDAGKPIPFQILVQVGMQVIKVLGSIANEKGYLPEDQVEVFLKEAFQQSLAKYAQLDVQAGKMTQQQVQQVQQKLRVQQGGQTDQMAPDGGQPPPAAPMQPPGGQGALAQAGG